MFRNLCCNNTGLENKGRGALPPPPWFLCLRYHNPINDHFAAHIVEHVVFHRNCTFSLLDPHSWADYTQGACILALDLLELLTCAWTVKKMWTKTGI